MILRIKRRGDRAVSSFAVICVIAKSGVVWKSYGGSSGLSNPAAIKNPATTNVVTGFLVGVAGFEPAASWTRTMRDTKLRHTPIA